MFERFGVDFDFPLFKKDLNALQFEQLQPVV